MFKKSLIAVALVSAYALPKAVLAQEADTLPITGNLTFATDYAFRGVSQTDEDAAIQGGFDYAHSSGFFVGTWGSNVEFGGSRLELDFYGGWAKTWGDWGVNVGAIHYEYPGFSAGNTDEIYAAGSWKWFQLKYSATISDEYFGVVDSKGTGYAEVNFTYTLPSDFILGAHYGTTMYDGEAAPGTPNDDGDYDDYKVSINKVWKTFNFGLAYVGTDYDPPGGTPAVYDERVIFSIGKTF